VVNGNDQEELSTITPDNILLEDTVPIENSVSTDNQQSMFSIQDNSEDALVSTEEIIQ
jgi:hypothetical protein